MLHLLLMDFSWASQIWDAARCKKIRTMGGHRTRVGTLAWSSSLLASGSRDRSILQRDVRVQEDFVSKLSGHKSEVNSLIYLIFDHQSIILHTRMHFDIHINVY